MNVGLDILSSSLSVVKARIIKLVRHTLVTIAAFAQAMHCSFPSKHCIDSFSLGVSQFTLVAGGCFRLEGLILCILH